MRTLLHNLYRTLNCKILPHPAKDREADFKLFQLQIAQSVGMKVPFTVVANDATALDFFPLKIECFCIKALSAFHWYADNNSEYALRSAKVSRQQVLEHSSEFSLCPVLLQEYIEKRYEWRVTVIGSSVFACRINSQLAEDAKEDWRIANISELPHEIYELPLSLRQKLFDYLRYFDLSFGAFDFIETLDGDFVFLECNPNGQWLWIEHLTGAPISKTLSSYLFGE